MFADTFNTWELGLEPTPLFNAKEETSFVFKVEESFSKTNEDDDLFIMPSFEAPLELDIFEQELKKHEAVSMDIQEDLLISNSQEQARPLANSTFILEDDLAFDMANVDPKMLSASSFEDDDSGFMAMEESKNTANLIDEMESFLLQHEQAQPAPIMAPPLNDSRLDLLGQVMEEVEMMPFKEEEEPSSLSAQDSEQAEAILDALIKGDFATEFETSTNNAAVEIVSEETATTITTIIQPKPKKQPIFNGISNISEVITADGQKIVIVIANDMPQQDISTIKARVAATVVQQPSESEQEDYSSDSDWSPNSPADPRSSTALNKNKGVSVGRIAKQRGPYSKRAHACVKDKKERKKLQNVEAARRYRDKKKIEQNVVDVDEDGLALKNKALKKKFNEMENELKTLKKLMLELGLVK